MNGQRRQGRPVSILLVSIVSLLAALNVVACDKSKTDAKSDEAPASSAGDASKKNPLDELGELPPSTNGGASATPVGNDPAKPAAIPAPSDVAAPPADAQKTASGLVTKVLQKGTGKDHPAGDDVVRAHYTGWKKDGSMFDSSVARGEPLTFGLKEVIKGWTEGLALMVAGEKRRLWIPAALAYGDPANRPGAPAGDLVFDVELLEIVKAPKAPADVKAAPADAKKTASGLAYKVLKAGPAGGKSPAPTDKVTVHYSGWTTDGKMFDSSVMRGEPATFPVRGVIPGWTEGLQLMKVGDKVRFWIPAALAYGDTPKRPGTPAGPLVFDVELLAVR
jgi:FKBP-type peptidyl-prolyl cis-trans isomerase